MTSGDRNRWSRSFIAALFAWGLSGCGGGADGRERCPPDSAETGASEVQDSAGVIIVTTPCDMSFRSLGWHVDPVPVLDVGGDDENYFSRLSNAVGVSGDGVVALDVAPPRLLMFSGPEHSREIIATEGDGPGEIRVPILVRRASTDSVLVFDRRSRRFTEWVDLENRLFELHDTPWLAQLPLGVVGNAVLVEEYVIDFSLREPGLHREPLTFSWWSMADESRRAILETEFERSFTWIGETGRPTMGHLPYAAYPRASIHPYGAVVSLGGSFEILQFDTLGALQRIFRTPARRLPVDEQAVSTLRRSLDERPIGSISSDMVETMPLPDSIAAFRSLLVDRLGWTWAELETIDPTSPGTWLVFGRAGVARGTVELPASIVPFEIEEGRILGMWTDSLGVQRLRGLGLERGSGRVAGAGVRD